MMRTAILSAILCLSSPLVAAQGVELAQWEQTPEDPNMKSVCVNDLRYATEIANRAGHRATVVMLLRWAEQEAEKTAGEVPSEPLLSTGTEDILMEYIRDWYQEKPIYSSLRGGFVHWVYHSCMIGKPLYEKH